ncbi:MAG: NeuD/PglB/VioB family sugar acetyltransferase [Anaerolineales bacterium]
MKDPLPIAAPLLNPNEPESVVAELMVQEGDQVQAGDGLAVLETTKASMEVTADHPGYIVGISKGQGDSIAAGEILLWIAADPAWRPPNSDSSREDSTEADGGVRLTEPARTLAVEAGVNIKELPRGPMITRGWLEDWLAAQEDIPPVDERAIVVYGAGGHGKSVIELIQAIGTYEVVGLIDDGVPPGEQVMGIEVLGSGDDLHSLRQKGIGQAANAVGGIGDISNRFRVSQRLQTAGFHLPSLVHPTAFVEPSASYDEGVQVFPHAYLGSDARLGKAVIVNTSAVVSHDCDLGDYVNIAPGALIAGAVRIGTRSLVGMGVTINLNVEVGQGSRIGNSAVVKASVPAGSVVPAGSIWPVRSRREVSK